VKAGFHHGGEITSAADVRRSVLPDEQQLAARTFAALVPDAAGPSRGALVCLYTNTPDANFLIDSLPQHPGVHLVSACSGHGFKFSSAIGEIVADRVQGREPRVNTGAFAMKRFVDTSS
jgi:sarcosine oxidase